MRRGRRAGVPDVSVGQVSLPDVQRDPFEELGRRLLLALFILLSMVAVVWLDRDGYSDSVDGVVGLGDALYYTTVSISTTGYGDIAPITDQARLVNAIFVTPARVAFLVLLIGSTLEVLASEGRERIRIRRWSRTMSKPVVVIGYGTKGRSAIGTLRANGMDAERVVVVDPREQALQDAHTDGLAVVTGDATRQDVLRRAGVETAESVIVTTGEDATNVLATLTCRKLNPNAWIIASVSDEDNRDLIEQSGADSVITSADAVGRLIGLSTISPSLGGVLEDLLSSTEGLEVVERELLVTELGKPPTDLADQVIAVVRDERTYGYYDPAVSLLARGDKLIVVRPAEEKAWAARPGTHGEETASEPDLREI